MKKSDRGYLGGPPPDDIQELAEYFRPRTAAEIQQHFMHPPEEQRARRTVDELGLTDAEFAELALQESNWSAAELDQLHQLAAGYPVDGAALRQRYLSRSRKPSKTPPLTVQREVHFPSAPPTGDGPSFTPGAVSDDVKDWYRRR